MSEVEDVDGTICAARVLGASSRKGMKLHAPASA